MPRGRPRKDKFADIDAELKSNLENMSNDELRARVAAWALENAEIQAKKKEDQDLKEKAAAFASAGAVYKEAAKATKLRTEYVMLLLEARGAQ